MKATRVLVVLASIFALAPGVLGQSISGRNPVIHGEIITWPLAFEFDGSAQTIDVGNNPVLNPSSFTVSSYVKFNALSHPPGSNGDRPAPLRPKAYTLLSFEPTYTTPLATEGEDCTKPPVAKLHNSAPVVAFRA